MPKSDKQDPPKPEEEALEKRVREMMDVNVPDEPVETGPPPAPVKKAVSIKVVDHTDVAPMPAVEKPSLNDAIAATNEQLATQATAPLVTPPKPPKTTKVTVVHADDDVEPIDTNQETQDQDVNEVPAAEVQVEPEAQDIADETDQPEEQEKTVQDAIDEAAEQPEEDASPLEAEIESPATEQAVSDIVAHESDELLAVQDSQLPTTTVPRKKGRTRAFFSAWIHSSAARWATFLLVFAGLAAVGSFPNSRYWVLNKAGVKSSASVVVSDASTLRPLKNVAVTVAGHTVQTDVEGRAQFEQLQLGPTEVVVSKRAFAEERKNVTIGWGSNPLGDVSLKPVGNQYIFVVTDMLSGKPIASAEVVLGESSATSSDDGKAILTLEETEADTADVVIKAAGYRDEATTLDLNSKSEVKVALTPNQKIAFISKRSGTYDIYTIDADGKNEKLIVAGSGSETTDITFAQHPAADRVALVSTRDGKRSSDGVLLSSLTFVNLADGATKSVIESPQIRLVGWAGNRLVYVQQVTGASVEDPQRYKLMSYDYLSGDNRQLAAANYFNDVIVINKKVYFAPSSAYQNGVNVGVFVVEAGGDGKQPIFDQESWNMYRTAYDHLALAVQQDWYDFVIGSSKPTKLNGQPSSTTSRVYTDSPDGSKSVWVDSRDGKGTLVMFDTQTKQETVIYAQAGIKHPVRWLNNATLVYRLADSETADYAISINGGEPKKIVDVSDTTSIDNWSY